MGYRTHNILYSVPLSRAGFKPGTFGVPLIEFEAAPRLVYFHNHCKKLVNFKQIIKNLGAIKQAKFWIKSEKCWDCHLGPLQKKVCQSWYGDIGLFCAVEKVWNENENLTSLKTVTKFWKLTGDLNTGPVWYLDHIHTSPWIPVRTGSDRKRFLY